MKKKLSLMCVCGLTLSLFAFSPVDKSSVDYEDLSSKIFFDDENSFGSFVEAEESATAEDQSTWVKRHKEWTILGLESNNAAIALVLSKN